MKRTNRKVDQPNYYKNYTSEKIPKAIYYTNSKNPW